MPVVMNQADEKAIRQGLEAAERQIAEIDARLAEIEKLRDRRSALESYIAHAKVLLGEQEQTPTVTTELLTYAQRLIASQRGGTGEEKPIWADAASILAKAQRPMPVPEIVEALRAGGRKFGGEHVTEVVRGALNRRPEIFENISKGRYALKTWPDEWKKREG
jgi:hypothetical protein